MAMLHFCQNLVEDKAFKPHLLSSKILYSQQILKGYMTKYFFHHAYVQKLMLSQTYLVLLTKDLQIE